MALISDRFLEARTPPKGLGLRSRQLQDWYDEHLYYAHYGRSINGFDMTGDQYWFLNFTPIELFYTDPISRIEVQKWGYPRFCQADDYVFKQIEEARKEKMATMMFTARAYGKTYLVISIGIKMYYLEVGSHNIISAAIDDHAKPTFDKVKKVMNELEERHPALGLKRLNDNDDIIQAGENKIIGGEKKQLITSQMEKIVYGNSPGKTKGRRVRFHHFEEMGDWSCSAKLTDCIASSEGTWKVGGTYLARVFYTGTGGTIKSDQARQLFFNPLTYNIYPVVPYEERKISVLIPEYELGVNSKGEKELTPIFMPAIVKRGDYYEFERKAEDGTILFEAGQDDLEGAFADVEKDRKQKEGDPVLLDKNTQEFPYTRDECFRQGGVGVFDRARLGVQQLRLKKGQLLLPGSTLERPRHAPDIGRLEWVYNSKGRKIGVRFEFDPNGKVVIIEHPPMDEQGRLLPIAHAYVGGLDSIDFGKDDSMSEIGSELALAIKKRQTGIHQTSNFYAAFYAERPNDPDDAYDNVLKMLWYYSCQVNLEFTKISIRSYFSQRGEYWRFLQRPRIAMGSLDPEKFASMIGTQMNDTILQHGIRRLKQHLLECMPLMFYDRAIKQLIDYNLAQKTKFDLVVAMILAELADEEMADVPPAKVKEPEPVTMPCWYQDPDTGRMRWGVPQQSQQQLAHRELHGGYTMPNDMIDFIGDDGQPLSAKPMLSEYLQYTLGIVSPA